MLKMRFTKAHVESFWPATALLTALSLLAGGVPLLASTSSEEALRRRVEQLYSALEQGDMRQAEKYLTKDSKPIFRAQPLKPAPGYQIDSIKLDPGGATALVVVKVPALLPMADQPIAMAQQTQWRLVRGGWYLQLERPDAQGLKSPFTARQEKAPLPALTSPKDLKFQTNYVALSPTHPGEVKVARFPFTNISNHNVTLAEVQIGCECLRLKTQQKEFKPGEAGVLEFELDSSSLQFIGPLTIAVLVKTEPENAYNKLAIGTVLVAGPAQPVGP
jgi:hypothetical protein